MISTIPEIFITDPLNFVDVTKNLKQFIKSFLWSLKSEVDSWNLTKNPFNLIMIPKILFLIPVNVQIPRKCLPLSLHLLTSRKQTGEDGL